MLIRLRQTIADLNRSRRGLALMEFALSLPLFLLMALTGAELCNFITVKMRVSQLALQIADGAARMGEGSQLAAKTISETDINDVFIGGNKQANELDLLQTGRVILSDLEADPSQPGKYKIMWQRCYGNGVHSSKFGTEGQGNLSGIGPAGSLVTTQTNNATMFVEIYLPYKPLLPISGYMRMDSSFDDYASMSVRDRRDLTQIYNTENATVSRC